MGQPEPVSLPDKMLIVAGMMPWVQFLAHQQPQDKGRSLMLPGQLTGRRG